MFSGLREKSSFYMLERKGGIPEVRIGQVISVSNPQPKFGVAPNIYNQPIEQTVDVRVDFEGDALDLKQLPASAAIANFGNNGVVVADNSNAMLQEVEGILKSSQAILDSVELNEEIVRSCTGIIEKLNPAIAKERRQEQRIDYLEQQIGGISGKLDLLVEALNKNNNSRKNNQAV